MSNDSTKPAAGKPHQTSPGTSGPLPVGSGRVLARVGKISPKLGASSSGSQGGDTGSAVADLVPGTRGGEKPRVFLWEAAAAAVRVVGSADAPWFVAKDVCAVLDLERTDSALRGLEDDEKGAHIVSTLGGPQELSTVNESGLYALIFRSRKEQARVFRRWVTSEVLPQIRKTGAYAPARVALPPGRIEIFHGTRPVSPVPTEESAVARLLAEIIGRVYESRSVVVHATTIEDLAVRDALFDWLAVGGGHRQRSRLMACLRSYFGRWLRHPERSGYYSLTPIGEGAVRRYAVGFAFASDSPLPGSIWLAESQDAVAIVARAQRAGGEVVVP